MSKKRYLKCCCCGGEAGQWMQHGNQDTGWGICMRCIEWVRKRGMSDEEIKRLYGVEGVNYGSLTGDSL